MTWALVTAPDERERCCVVIDGQRCERPTVWRVAAEDGAWDDYTYACEQHLEMVMGPGYRAERVTDG